MALAGVGLSTAVLWLAALRRRPIAASRRPILPLPPLPPRLSVMLFALFCRLFLCCFSFFRWLTLLVMVVAAVVVVDGGGG